MHCSSNDSDQAVSWVCTDLVRFYWSNKQNTGRVHTLQSSQIRKLILYSMLSCQLINKSTQHLCRLSEYTIYCFDYTPWNVIINLDIVIWFPRQHNHGSLMLPAGYLLWNRRVFFFFFSLQNSKLNKNIPTFVVLKRCFSFRKGSTKLVCVLYSTASSSCNHKPYFL